MFFTQPSHTPFWDIYVHKTLPSPPQNTPFPGLNLKVGKMNYSLGNLDPNCAKCLISRQNFSRSGQKKLIISRIMKDVQESPTKKIHSELKDSVTRLIHHERAKFPTVLFNGVERSSDIGSLKALAVKIFMQDAIRAHIHGLSIGAPQCIDCFKTFCTGKGNHPGNARLLQYFQLEHDPMRCQRL